MQRLIIRALPLLQMLKPVKDQIGLRTIWHFSSRTGKRERRIEGSEVIRSLSKRNAFGNDFERWRNMYGTGLPNKQLFLIVVSYVRRLSAVINYFYGWKFERIQLEDQIFLALMKLWQNYTNLHMAELFHCSTATNCAITGVSVNIPSFLYTGKLNEWS